MLYAQPATTCSREQLSTLVVRAQAGGDIWAGSTALAIAVGPASDELRYLKSITLHLYLFGYELPGERRHIATLLDFACVHCHTQIALMTSCAMCYLSAADTVLGFTRTALHVVTSSKKGARCIQQHRTAP